MAIDRGTRQVGTIGQKQPKIIQQCFRRQLQFLYHPLLLQCGDPEAAPPQCFFPERNPPPTNPARIIVENPACD